MAYRELGVIEIREVLRRFCLGEGLRAIARGTGSDRKTVAKYVMAAVAAGLRRGDAVPTDEQVMAVVAAIRPPAVGRPAAMPDRLVVHQEQIAAWLADGLRLTKIHRRLHAQGVTVPYSSLHRFAQARLGFGTPSFTVRVADPPPGEAAEIDFGVLGLWPDPILERRRHVYGLLITLCFSRYAFLAISLRQDLAAVLDGLEAAWTFFGGVVRRLVADNLAPVVARADRYTPGINRVFLEYAQYRGFLVDPAVPATRRVSRKSSAAFRTRARTSSGARPSTTSPSCSDGRSSGVATSPARACTAPPARSPASCSRRWSTRRCCPWRPSPLIAPCGRGPRSIPITTSNSGAPSTPCPRATSATASRSAAIPASCGSTSMAR